MQPINKQDVLIRLLKDGHISNEEFARWWDRIKPISFFEKVVMILRGISPEKRKLANHLWFMTFYTKVIVSLNSELPVMRSGYLHTDSGTPLFPVGQITCGTGGSKIGSKELEKDFKGMHPKTWAFLNKEHGN